LARVAAFAALGAFGAAHWAGLVRPAESGRMLGATAVALGLAVFALAAVRLRPAARAAAVALATGSALLASLAVVGVSGSLVAPAGWGGLVDGLRQGIDSLAEVRIPYQGSDPWPEIAILAGGAALLAIAALATALPRRPGGLAAGRVVGVLALGTLYVVPAVDVPGSHQFLRGAAFALLLAAYLWLDRVPLRGAPAAAAAIGVALAAGLLLAPSFDRGRPWVDYEAIARDLAQAGTVSYDFDHTYGPLNWPRTGRELARVSAPRETYWKSANLDDFDGARWQRSRETSGGAESLQAELPDFAGTVRRWTEHLRVTIRGLRSHDVVAAGTVLGVRGTPSAPVWPDAPGPPQLGRLLRSGDSYVADVYAPRPSPRQLASAGTEYPSQLSQRYLTLTLPQGGGEAARVTFAPFSSGQAPVVSKGDFHGDRTGTFDLPRTPYAPAEALARRLAARSQTPYELVQRVLAYLAQPTFAYTEQPVPSRYPLETFLFRDRVGYCQHFSGAMALLLRMAGVPARVVGGFSPGTYDRRRREWVVRDYDAHSWVEAYFPGQGWVTFDPTPGESPARSQLLPIDLPRTPTGAVRPSRLSTRGDRPEPGRRLLDRAGGGNDNGAPVGRIALAAALLVVGGLAALGLGVGGGRRRRSPPPDGETGELERALRRCGRPAEPGTTLRGLERRFAGDPDALGYLRALAARRYASRGAGPTPAQRAGLRRALARGLGAGGRLRALWALPPRGVDPRSRGIH
jgi:protein-glutamine gamma-glutamyltransferase